MTSDELRTWAAELRTKSAQASQAHAQAARKLLTPQLSKSQTSAIQVEANVHDCMARRNRQWADALEVVAYEIDEDA